jgi:hypothetical protein
MEVLGFLGLLFKVLCVRDGLRKSLGWFLLILVYLALTWNVVCVHHKEL